MKLWLLTNSDGETQRAMVFFFRRSAMAHLKYLVTRGGKWRKMTGASKSEVEFWRCADNWISVARVPLLFRSWSLLGWFRARYHSQNLNEDRLGRVKGSILRYGRAWFRFRRERYDGLQIMWSWHFSARKWFGADMDLFDGDSYHDIGFSLHLGLAHFYLTLENILPKKYGYPRHSWAHTWGLVLFEDHLHLEIHHGGDDCYHCGGWKGWHRGLFVHDFLFGRAKFEEKVISTHTATVPMPEGSYPATVEIKEQIWRRPRWFTKKRVCSYIKVDGGVPVPGKGENSWDCGEDGIWATGSSTPTVAGAVAQMVKSALETRERHGGKNWIPAKSSRLVKDAR